MKTYAVIKRELSLNDYEDIKYQAKARRTHLKDLADSCGLTYKQFYRCFKGYGDATRVAEQLLDKGYELKEIR